MKRILITAGPTREPIDAVRFISNRSSGTLGLALARAAAEAQHHVTLLLGPVPAPPDLPPSIRIHRFESSAELKQLLDAHFADCDILIMAAAVADYRPLIVQPGKLPRSSADRITLELHPTPDLVAQLAQRKKPHQRIVAFALEERDQLEARAREKLQRKRVDAIVANPLGTMESPDITATWITAAATQSPGRLPKPAFATWLLNQINTLFN